MYYLTFDYKGIDNYWIDENSLKFEWLSDNIEKAETIDLNMSKGCFGREIIVLRIHNAGEVLKIVCRFYAGITEDETEYSIHLCAPEENEKVGRTIWIRKEDNKVKIGNYYSVEY